MSVAEADVPIDRVKAALSAYQHARQLARDAKREADRCAMHERDTLERLNREIDSAVPKVPQ